MVVIFVELQNWADIGGGRKRIEITGVEVFV